MKLTDDRSQFRVEPRLVARPTTVDPPSEPGRHSQPRDQTTVIGSLQANGSRRMPAGWLKLAAPLTLVFVLAACGQKAPSATPGASTSTSGSPSAGPTTTLSVPSTSAPTSPTGATTTPHTIPPRLSVTATLARSCGGATHAQCLTEARAAVKNDAILAAQKCAPGAPEGCHRQFGDPLVQACYPASAVPAWGPDGWCTLINDIQAGGMPAAEAYAQGQAPAGFPFSFIAPDVTWAPSATLHVLHATPQGSASYGGDYYFFFVNGTPVGKQFFTGAVTSAAVDSTTYAVTYKVYKPGDAHCCPSGGQSKVKFHWDGTKVSPLDPMPGTTQS
jgi:predicted small lipoprotein YifL